jgi:hypothetical protein
MPIIRYTAEIVQGMVTVLQEVDRKTRKLLGIHRAFDLIGDVHRLDVKSMKSGKKSQGKAIDIE